MEKNCAKTGLPANMEKNMYTSYAQPFCTDLHYRLLHYSTKTNEYMHKSTKNINPKCNYCQNVAEPVVDAESRLEFQKLLDTIKHP